MAKTSSAPSVPRRKWWRRLRRNEQIRFDSILNSGFNSVHVWVHLTLRWRSIKRLFVLSLFGCGCVDNLIGYVSFQGRPSTLTPYDAMKLDMFIASLMLQNMFSPGLSRVSSNWLPQSWDLKCKTCSCHLWASVVVHFGYSNRNHIAAVDMEKQTVFRK